MVPTVGSGGDLLKLPSQRTQQNLDRALFDLAQRFASSRAVPQTHTQGDGTSRKIHGLEAERASEWMGKLVEAGANPHYQPKAQAAYNRSQWFIGRMEGLDVAKLADNGWEIKQGNTYMSHPDTALRTIEPGSKIDLPSAADMVFQHNGPIAWRVLVCPLQSLDEAGRTRFQTIGEIFDQSFSNLTCFWKNATPDQWLSSIQALNFAHADAVFEKSGTKVHSWCPQFMLEGFSLVEIENLASPLNDTPHCPWLDCIGLHLRAKEQGLEEIARFHENALQIMATRLHGNADAFVRGLQRACVIKSREGKSRFSFMQYHASIDEFLAIAGVDDLLQSMGKDFIESFEAFAVMDRDMQGRWKRLSNPDKDCLDSEESLAIEQASQTLKLHRSILPSLVAHSVEPARPGPRI